MTAHAAPPSPQERQDGASLILRTRLSPPVRPSGAVHRHRLAAQDFRRALTVVKGPAGYGKSILMGQWFEQLRRAGAAVGWLSLDPTPDELMGFVRHLVAALQVSRPEFGRQIDLLFGSAARPSTAGVTATLMNRLAALDEDVYLFLDDFHLATDPEVIEATRAMTERQAAHLHFVVASRHALPFSLSRLRAKGAAAEIDTALLRFDAQEAAEFLRTAGHGDLSLADIDALVSRTEGWAAGLQLAAILLAQNPDRGSLFSLLEGRHRHLSEYLTDDVIDRLAPETADFLAKTSILTRLCAELCDAVTGLGNARAQLDELERQSLFLSSLDSERVWYRYHHLFGGVLNRRLLERRPSLAPDLHRRACAWFAERGFVDEAFAHALEAGEPDRAAGLLDGACDRMLYGGRLSTVLRWADRLPAASLRPFPRLRLQAAFSMILEWKFAAAARHIAEVEQDLASGAAEADAGGIDIRHIVSHRKLMLRHFMDDTAETERIINETVAEFPDIDPYLRGNLETCMIYARREKYRLVNVERMDVHARDYYERAGSLFVAVWHEAVLGPTYYLRGDVEMAERSLETSMRTAERIDGEMSPLVAMPALLLADIAYERNDLTRAAELIGKFGAEAEKQGFVDHLVAFYVTRARLAARRGDAAGALEAAREGHLSAARHGFARLENFLLHEDMRRAVAAGDLDEVRALMEILRARELDGALDPGPHTTTRDEPVAMAHARALGALGDHAGAARTARRWAAFAGHRGALKTEVRALVLLAVALLRGKREAEALRALREAVRKAARPRFVRSFLDEGAAIASLLAKTFAGADAQLGPTTAFGLELLRLFAAESGERDAVEPPPGGDGPPETLSARESEVLRLVAQGLSNREIGERLGLTEGSVKWHLQGVFAKLGVRRRAAAMVKARKFGLA